MPEQLLASEPADPEHDDHEQKPGRRGALDLTALRALRDSRTDVEALDLTAERLRHLQDVYTEAGEAARTRAVRAARRPTPNDADAAHPMRQHDQHPSQQPGPHRGRKGGPDGLRPVGSTVPDIHSTGWSPLRLERMPPSPSLPPWRFSSV